MSELSNISDSRDATILALIDQIAGENATAMAGAIFGDGETVRDVARQFGVSRSTAHRRAWNVLRVLASVGLRRPRSWRVPQ